MDQSIITSSTFGLLFLLVFLVFLFFFHLFFPVILFMVPIVFIVVLFRIIFVSSLETHLLIIIFHGILRRSLILKWILSILRWVLRRILRWVLLGKDCWRRWNIFYSILTCRVRIWFHLRQIHGIVVSLDLRSLPDLTLCQSLLFLNSTEVNGSTVITLELFGSNFHRIKIIGAKPWLSECWVDLFCIKKK